MADAVEALQALLSGPRIEDDTQALKTANAVINATKSKPPSPELLAAQHTKIVAFLKLDRFDDALRVIADAGSAVENHCALEHAYALYKTGELQAAAKLCESKIKSEDETRGLRHVAAQVDYRLEAFASAAQAYEQLRDEANDGETVAGEEQELRVNILATNAQLSWNGQGSLVAQEERQPAREDLEVFETAYNAGSLCLARGDFAKASVLLKRAKDLLEASENMEAEDKSAELVPIVVQQAYVLTKLGKPDAAAELYKSIELSENIDASTKAIIQNNTLLAKHEPNPFLTQRRYETVEAPTAGNSRPFEFQASTLRRNKYTIELQCQKFEGVASSTRKHLKKIKDTATATSRSAIDLGILNAAATANLASGKDALKRILPLLDSRPDDVGLLLTIIQLYVQARNPFQAITLLEAFFKRLEAATTPNTADVRFAPGLVAVAVALYKLAGRHNAVRAELAKGSSHWQSSSSSESASLLRQAGIELLASSRPADHTAAGAAFSRLASTSPSDRLATAGLVASFATSDFAKVEPHLATLTPIEKLTAGTDAAALLAAGVATLPAPAVDTKKRKREGDEKAQTQPARKKRRARELPKDYDPDKKMDPERWLPLRDRSSWRP